MHETTPLSAKLQISIPKNVRAAHQLSATGI